MERPIAALNCYMQKYSKLYLKIIFIAILVLYMILPFIVSHLQTGALQMFQITSPINLSQLCFGWEWV